MARSLDPNRLEDLAQAGFRAFAEKGFRRTQMADVARELGCSAGGLYKYVASKEALFLLVLHRQNVEAPLRLPAELPIRAPTEERFLEEVGKQLRRRVNMTPLQVAAEGAGPSDCAQEFEGIVRAIYQSLSRGRGVLILLERSVSDWPELSSSYGGSTGRYIKRLKRYLEVRGEAGKLRIGPSAHASARLIAETCTWFAIRRPQLQRPSGIDDETAEQTVVDTLCRAFLPATGPAVSGHARPKRRGHKS